MSRMIIRGIFLVVAVLSMTCKPRHQSSEIASASGLSAEASLFNPGNRTVSWKGKDRFLGSIQPVLAARCVACHGCTDAPCSAKLTSYEYISRGANGSNPYAPHVFDSTFVAPVNATGFYPIHGKGYNDSLIAMALKFGKANTTDKDPTGSFNLETLEPLRAAYAKSSKYECPTTAAAYQSFLTKNPMAGMPFGMSRINDDEHRELMSWIAETAGKGPSDDAGAKLLTPANTQVINAWDKFLNASPTVPSRSALVARYLYEHWFNAHIAFNEMPGEFYRMIRTTEAPGPSWNDPQEIVTQLPTDDPNTGGKPVYYRFKKVTEVITQKAHVVMELSDAKMDSFKKLFFESQWNTSIKQLPGYSTASPFENFKDIPEDIRYKFMLENSHYIVDNMVRSPVCVGQSATYAIADHFWVFFLKPSSDPSSGAQIKMSEDDFKFLTLDVKAWGPASKMEDRFVNNYNYLFAYEDALRANLAKQNKSGLDLGDLWFGEPLRKGGVDHDRNAWLSVTRHDISTTVQYGVKGGFPQSLWVLDYANFERLYYNLVVNFKYWGGTTHKIGTWRSMSHERLDGEDLFLSFLPKEARNSVRQQWSGGLELSGDLATLSPLFRPLLMLKTGIDVGLQPIKRYIDLYPLQSLREYKPDSPIQYPSRTGALGLSVARSGHEYDSVIEFSRKIRDKMVAAHVSSANDPLNADRNGETIYVPSRGSALNRPFPRVTDFDSFEKGLAILGEDRGLTRYAAALPAATIARVKAANGDARVYTFIGNRQYLSHNLPLISVESYSTLLRNPGNDTVSIYRGVVGDRPDLFLDIPIVSERHGSRTVGANEFLAQVQKMTFENYKETFTEFRNDYVVMRNTSSFWPFYDWLHDWMIRNENDSGPGLVHAGILDLQKYDHL